MSITVLRGLPGAGKSSRLIESVNAAIEQGRPVLTFACSDSPWLTTLKHIQVDRMLVCRRPGLTCPLNHFVSAAECAEILRATAPGTLVAFDEAYWFGSDIAPHWIDASQRGLDVLIVWPSEKQRKRLRDYEYTETTLTMTCQRCAESEACIFVYLPNRETILSICASCRVELTEAAQREIRERLDRQSTSLGQNTLYQPLPLEEYADWNVVRSDAPVRGKIMSRVSQAVGLLGEGSDYRPTYLDIGCGTGYFCNHLRRQGFYYIEGIDLSEDTIAIAKLIDSFFLRDNNVYKVTDYYRYLRDARDRLFDVISAFDITSWPANTKSARNTIACLTWMFAKTRHACFLDLGCAQGSYEQGEGALDRSSLIQIMVESGYFSRILVFEAQANDLLCDLLVGLKAPTSQAADEVLVRLGAHIQEPELQPRLRMLVRAVLPRDATVIVVSRGDAELMELDGRRAWHFPQTPEGWYAGYHPADSAEAIAHLEALRAKGGDFLLFPSTALWWLEYYVEFKEHLERHYRSVVRQEDACVIFALRETAADPVA